MYDIAIIGGGINGCGIARDAAGRGYRVFLADKGDLAQGTSSGSTKLIHGGLRYLEHFEFKLVREALAEREVLWSIAPHIIRPMRFVLPHVADMRPAWMLRAGLFLYDHIGGRKRLAPTRTIDLSKDTVGEPLRPGFKRGYEYSDCWVDDARLVVLNAADAARRGAVIRTRMAFEKIARDGDHWTANLRNVVSGEETSIQARMIVNASGPWVDEVLGTVAGLNEADNVRLVQGSHIVVPRMFDHDRSYIFQNADQRVVFAIPYEEDFTLLGTTDREITGSPDDVTVSDDEVDYICSAVNVYFDKSVSAGDVVWSFAALRPLLNDGSDKAQEATRDYVLKMDGTGEDGRLLNVFGGKITTYRRLAEAVLDDVDAVFGQTTTRWTGRECLPGGDFAAGEAEALGARLHADYPFLDMGTIRRLVASYGTIARDIVGDARKLQDLGRDFGAGLFEREVRHLQASECAMMADDILWRRSKLGLREIDRDGLAAWLEDHPVARVGVT